jgi:hypothetical protein
VCTLHKVCTVILVFGLNTAVLCSAEQSSSEANALVIKALIERVERLEQRLEQVRADEEEVNARTAEILKSMLLQQRKFEDRVGAGGVEATRPLPSTFSDAEITFGPSDPVINVAIGDPTVIEFEAAVDGGWMRKSSGLSLQPRDNVLAVFPSSKLQPQGEAIAVRLKDGRIYRMHFAPADASHPAQGRIKVSSPKAGKE